AFEMKYLESKTENEIKNDFEIKFAYINSVNERLSHSSYNDYLEIWMQRVVVKNLNEDTKLSNVYIEQSKNRLVQLCNSVIGDKETKQIFNEEWLKAEYKLDLSKFIDSDEIRKLADVISSDEIYLAEYSLMT
ncbi:reverse transcriptase, partial [Listeria ivanovii]